MLLVILIGIKLVMFTGLNKMVINHLGKLFVTHDAATVVKELEVEHPVAKLLVLATQTMNDEVLDEENVCFLSCFILLSLSGWRRNQSCACACW